MNSALYVKCILREVSLSEVVSTCKLSVPKDGKYKVSSFLSTIQANRYFTVKPMVLAAKMLVNLFHSYTH